MKSILHKNWIMKYKPRTPLGISIDWFKSSSKGDSWNEIHKIYSTIIFATLFMNHAIIGWMVSFWHFYILTQKLIDLGNFFRYFKSSTKPVEPFLMIPLCYKSLSSGVAPQLHLSISWYWSKLCPILGQLDCLLHHDMF